MSQLEKCCLKCKWLWKRRSPRPVSNTTTVKRVASVVDNAISEVDICEAAGNTASGYLYLTADVGNFLIKCQRNLSNVARGYL